MDCSAPGLSVHHQFPEFAQTHIHRVGDAIQPSHPLSSPSLPAFNLSQHQGLFASGTQSIGVSASASVLPVNIQDWFPLGLTSWISLQSKGLSRIFSNTTVQKHQFFRSKEQASFNFMTAVTICSDFAAQENFGGKLNHGLWCWRVPWFPHLCCVT